MKAKREQKEKEIMVIKMFTSNYAIDLRYKPIQYLYGIVPNNSNYAKDLLFTVY